MSPFLQQDSGQIHKDDVNGFSFISDIFFMLFSDYGIKSMLRLRPYGHALPSAFSISQQLSYLHGELAGVGPCHGAATPLRPPCYLHGELAGVGPCHGAAMPLRPPSITSMANWPA